MPTVQELILKYRKALPNSERFKTHAVNLAWLAFEGKVEQAHGYLAAMRADWAVTSRHFDAERFHAFRTEVLSDAKGVLRAETQALLGGAGFVRPQVKA